MIKERRLDGFGYLPESLIVKNFFVLGWSPEVPFEYNPFTQTQI